MSASTQTSMQVPLNAGLQCANLRLNIRTDSCMANGKPNFFYRISEG